MRESRKLSWLEVAALGVLGSLKLASSAPAQESKIVEDPFKDTVRYSQSVEGTVNAVDSSEPVKDIDPLRKNYFFCIQVIGDSEKPIEVPLFSGFGPIEFAGPVKPIEKPAEESGFEFYVENTVTTNYVFGNGLIIGRKNPEKHGGVNQTLFCVSKGDLSAFIWGNYDFQDKELHEVDVGIDRNITITDNLSATVGYWSWNYPSELLGEHGDHVIHGAMSYSGPVDLEACLLHLIDHEDVEAGLFYSGKIAKTFQVGKFGRFNASVTPSFELAVTNKFYDDFKGLKAMTSGFDMDLVDGDFGIKGFVRFLDGKDGPDLCHGGVTASYSF